MEKVKMTNRKALEFVLENCTIPTEVEEKLTSMIAALDRKNGAERKPTAVQIENEKFKTLILSVVGAKGMTVTDIIKAVPEFEGFSNQKISALVRQLKEEGKLVKTVEKGRSFFSKA